MFPIVVAINIWGASLKNKKILFHNDNQAVVAILNKKMGWMTVGSWTQCPEKLKVTSR
jgi:uncharacterized membrane protein